MLPPRALTRSSFCSLSSVRRIFSNSTRVKMFRELDEAQNNGCNAHNSRNDCRSRKKLFSSNDNRDHYHHERIHDSQSELNRHRRGATGTTRRALFVAKPLFGVQLRDTQGIHSHTPPDASDTTD